MYFLLYRTITSLPDKTSIDEHSDDIESPIESHGKDQSPLRLMIPETSNTSIESEQSWPTSASPSSNQQQQKRKNKFYLFVQ